MKLGNVLVLVPDSSFGLMGAGCISRTRRGINMKKRLLIISTSIMLAFGVYQAPGQQPSMAHAATSYVQGTIVNSVYFRSAPSSSSSIYGVLKTGTVVQVLAKDGYWLKVSYKNVTGYITSSSNYVSLTTNGSLTTQATLADRIISTGKKYIGTPYLFGSSSYTTKTFDCSSFTQYIFRVHGVSLPRSSREQAAVGYRVSYSQLKKGDLIFFHTASRTGTRVDHVAVYIGNGQILHAVPKGGVQISSFSGYWYQTALFAKRVL